MSSCTTSGSLDLGAVVIKLGFCSDVYICSALVDTYGKCGSSANAQKKFDEMSDRNVVTWNCGFASFSLEEWSMRRQRERQPQFQFWENENEVALRGWVFKGGTSKQIGDNAWSFCNDIGKLLILANFANLFHIALAFWPCLNMML